MPKIIPAASGTRRGVGEAYRFRTRIDPPTRRRLNSRLLHRQLRVPRRHKADNYLDDLALRNPNEASLHPQGVTVRKTSVETVLVY